MLSAICKEYKNYNANQDVILNSAVKNKNQIVQTLKYWGQNNENWKVGQWTKGSLCGVKITTKMTNRRELTV